MGAKAGRKASDGVRDRDVGLRAGVEWTQTETKAAIESRLDDDTQEARGQVWWQVDWWSTDEVRGL